MHRLLIFGIPFALLVACGPSSGLPNAMPGAVQSTTRQAAIPATITVLLYAGGPQGSTSAVSAYPAIKNNPPPSHTFSYGISYPTGIAVDASHDVYIASNSGHANDRYGKGTWTVTVYQRGGRLPIRTYSSGVHSPVDVAVAPDGTVFIANAFGGVTVYPPGSVYPSRTLTGPASLSAMGIAFDRAGNVFVSYVVLGGSPGGSVYEYAPGQTTGKNLNLVFSGSPHGLAIDAAGNVILAVSRAPGPGSDVEIYPPGGVNPTRKIAGTFQPFMLALADGGRHLFVADFGSGNGDGGVFKYDYASGALIAKDSRGAAGSAYGVAIDK